MPEICRFYGISIILFPNDHNPPHFHARYGEHIGVVCLNPPRLQEGYLPPKALGMVLEWAEIHEQEILVAWESLQSGKLPGTIDPLK